MKNYLSPRDLISRLDVAPSVEMTFHSERALQAYRQALYKENKWSNVKFSTRRLGLTIKIIRFY